MSDNQEAKELRYSEMPLSEPMQAALQNAQYEYPSPIQEGVIPLALEGKDIVGQARTGTGKTAAFAIPILERLKPSKEVTTPQALILVPTRELAVQVRDEIAKLSYGQRIECVALYGGKPLRGQIDKLQRNPQIVVGTPGRVIDHISRRTFKLDSLSMIVLDEADRMLDIGFRPDIEKILRQCPTDRQMMLLSATVPPPIERIAQRFMNDPVKLDFSPKNISAETIDQYYFTVDQSRKYDLLVQLLIREQPRKAIVFCRTKRGTDRLQKRLARKTSLVRCIHGDLAQGARNQTLSDFKSGKYRILIATDVVGRGIDISQVSHIINFDIPAYSDDYVHRVGRTGRMGQEGVAYSFVTPEEGGELTSIEMRIEKLLMRDEMPGFECYEKTSVDTGPGLSEEDDIKEVGLSVAKPEGPPPKMNSRKKKYRRAL